MPMMPIQRQSESYDGLNGSEMRFAKEYTTRDLPPGLADALSRGVGITAGMNVRHAVNTDGMDPNSHAYAVDEPYHPSDFQSDPGGRLEFSSPEAEDRHERAVFDQRDDDDSGYNWGPEPDAYREDAPMISPDDVGGFGHGNEESYDRGPEHLDAYMASQSHLASFGEAHTGGPAPKVAAAISPQVVPGWVGHGYAPGHRVGLPWRGNIIPGTVTHLDGQMVGTRWDDGQHSTEEPSDLRPL